MRCESGAWKHNRRLWHHLESTDSINVPLSPIVSSTPLFLTASFPHTIAPLVSSLTSSLLQISLPSPISPSDVFPEAVYTLYYCASSVLSTASHARLVTACESGCEDVLWLGKPSFPLLSQLIVQNFSSGLGRRGRGVGGFVVD